MQKDTEDTDTLDKSSFTLMDLLSIFEEESEKVSKLPINTSLLAVVTLSEFIKRYSNSVRIVY
ncbi:MAG: hypothetical protein ACE5KZ_08735 [Candidatus Scalinduaceae bacterium]